MAMSLPSGFRLSDQTTVEIDTGEIYDQVDDGDTRTRDVYGNIYYVINAVYGPLTVAESNQLTSFFNTNKGIEFTIPVDGINYTCDKVSPVSRSGIGVSRYISLTYRGTANA